MRCLYQLLFTSRQNWIMFNRKWEFKPSCVRHRAGDAPDGHLQPHGVTRPGATLKLPAQVVLNLPNGPDVTAHSLHGWGLKNSLYFHTDIWQWDATWMNWISWNFLDALLGLPPFHVTGTADPWGPFRFLLWFAEVGIQKGTDSKALNVQMVLEKFWKEKRFFHVKAALPCPGSVRGWVNRMYKTERSLKRKVAESCLCYKNEEQEATGMNRAW